MDSGPESDNPRARFANLRLLAEYELGSQPAALRFGMGGTHYMETERVYTARRRRQRYNNKYIFHPSRAVTDNALHISSSSLNQPDRS